MADLRAVEIFSSGTWNNDRYDECDLDDIVTAFDEVGFRPAVTLGHTKEPGGRAFGWVKRIWREGPKLLADLSDVPDELIGLIKQRAYDRVSAEVYWNLRRGGRVFRRALRAVALLGSEIPAVSGLRPLHETMKGFATMEFETVKTYSFPSRDGRIVDDPGRELDVQTREYADANNLSYRQAWQRVVARPANAELVRQYANPGYTPEPVKRYEQQDTPERSYRGKYVDKLVRKHMAECGETDYGAALQHVLRYGPRFVIERYASAQ